MSFLDKMTAFLPLGKKEEKREYFFAINIGAESLTAALWTLEGKYLKALDIASDKLPSNDEIVSVTDRLLDQVLGLKEIEPQKILFGVPNSWITDDNLKEEYLKILRSIVKELELTPMAYVSTSNALIHFLEKQEGVPTTAILVGFEKLHLTVTVVRAGKLDGVRVVRRGESAGSDIEKALLTFSDVETLPSKILVYGSQGAGTKSALMSFAWMSKLSFLHFPKIEALTDDVEIKSICLAGGSEINGDVLYVDQPSKKIVEQVNMMEEEEAHESPVKQESKPVLPEHDIKEDADLKEELDEENIHQPEDSSLEDDQPVEKVPEKDEEGDFGFVMGDISTQAKSEPEEAEGMAADTFMNEEAELAPPQQQHSLEIDDFEGEIAPPLSSPKREQQQKNKFNFKRFIPGSFVTLSLIFGVIGIVVLFAGLFLFLIKANIKVFVEPRILEKDAQVIADPNQKTVNEEGKIIPGQIIETEVSGSGKDTATGKRQIGDPAKGTVVIRNKTDAGVTLSKGTAVSSSDGLKFTLDTSVTVASRSADDGTWGKATGNVTASSIGADGNLPSGSDFSVAGYPADKLVAKSEGNFAGGTSKDVTVVSNEDTQRLLAKVSSDLRKQAQQKLQEKYPDKKILEEALSEGSMKKSYSKNVNDQASEFSLNITVKYKGTAFNDADLKTIVSKLIDTQVPDDFQLDLAETETQADVSKLEKDGKLIFLAKFRAKLMPKIDTEKIKNLVKFKSPSEVIEIIKGMDNVLGSEINLSPNLPAPLARLPILSKNIAVEVGLK